ncbi:hypothetical protein ACEXQE_09690 [Herbiconiux sp. P17]|uniref:hypothetical protein n=1 Tax=Herbiconiux wuyangfengii TaxID=3342794 RepID=UPI0035B95E12
MIKSHRLGVGIAAVFAVLLIAFGLVFLFHGVDSSTASSSDAPAPSATTSIRWASWRLLSTSGDGMELTLGVNLGGTCERLDSVQVEESDTSVTITPIVQTGLADACTDSLSLVQSTVDLDAPVGSRMLVHGDELH